MSDTANITAHAFTLTPDQYESAMVEIISNKGVFCHPKHPGMVFAAQYPTSKDDDAARVIQLRRMHELKAEGIPSRDTMFKEAVANGLIRNGLAEEKDGIRRVIHRNMVAKEQTRDHIQKAQITATIADLNERMHKLEMEESSVLSHAAESLAARTKQSFLVSRCTLGGDTLEDRVWPTWGHMRAETDADLVSSSEQALASIIQGLPTQVIRAIARHMEWRMRWRSARNVGGSPFDSNSMEWSPNRLSLVMWSKFYDSVYDHPECPDEEIIQNDDALQGWIDRQITNNKSAAHNSAPVTYVDGSGKRKVMSKIGKTQHKDVNTPYRIRTG